MKKHYKAAVIGGGAAGFAAAITIAGGGIDTVLLEGGLRTGRKLAASGNGQGNIANAVINPENYNCNLPLSVFEKVPYADVEKLFSSVGVATVQKERGRIYPQSLQASSIVDNFRIKLSELNAQEICGFYVKAIEKKNNIFYITAKDGNTVTANTVIIACGGKAHPHLSSGEGYSLLSAFGHKLTNLLPSLVQLKWDKKPYLKQLKGIRLENAAVKAISNNGIIKQSYGDVIFTDYGISGLAVFEVSGTAVKEIEKNANVEIVIDIFAHISENALIDILNERKNILGGRAAEHFLTGFIHKQYAKAIFEYCGTDTKKSINLLSQNDIKQIAYALKNFTVTVTGSLGFDYAQVTSGGIDIEGFNENLMSKYCDNLYACGEILDVDGDCGGYNLLWAFASGILCGKNVIKTIK